MKFTYLLILTLFFNFLTVEGQVTNQGQPKSWDLKVNTPKAISMQSFNLKSLKEEDAKTDVRKDKPFRFGYEHLVSLGFKDGKWTTLENGDKIWLLNLKSEGAKTLNFLFDEFYIPEGAKLYFYNEDRTDLLGAYTSSQNRDDMQFGTWLINGDNVWVEYYEPANARFNGQLHISKVVHGYRTMNDIPELRKALNDSEDCNQDVNCPIGNDFDDLKDELKKSVAMTIVNGSGFCSGTLINNTRNDGSQYFLTANHCLSSSVSSWAFRFNWISPDPSCSTTTNSTNGEFIQTLSGATLLANNSKSDFALLEINAPFPFDWDVVWAGWDRSGDIPNFTVGIHHPRGDIMKISRDNDSPSKNSRLFNGINNMDNWYLNEWEIGVTEPGSSGSALFDQNGKIIGQLAGGAAACAGTSNNGAFDYYGRFDVSWDFGNTDSTRLKNWLDPDGTGIMVLDHFPSSTIFNNDVALTVEGISDPICGDEAVPVFKILNRGLQTITSARLTYQLGNEPEESIQWSGNLASGENDVIASPVLDLTDGRVLQATINIDGAEDEFQENNSINREIDNFQDRSFTTDYVTFTLKTDNFASETSWAFYDEDGNIIQEVQKGSLDDNITYTEVFEVNPDRCYKLVIIDSESDGICCVYGEGSYTLETDSGKIIAEGGQFGFTESISFKVNEILSNSDFQFDIFPNPATTSLSIESGFEEDFNVKFFDIRGKMVYSLLASDYHKIDLSSLAAGVYFIRIDNGQQSKTKKFLKK